ncbi:MAG TPA: hypothetical protein VH328_09205 [Burkholderiaceae bacterium]|nr:hypothetical protein [Burkholderiaceae bacterium]
MAFFVVSGCVPTAPEPAGTATAEDELVTSTISVVNYGWQAAWTDVGSPFGDAPALASWGSGRVDLFLKNADQLIQKTRTTSWMPAGDHYWYIASGLASDPSAVGWGGKNLDIVFRAAGNNVMHVYWNGSGSWLSENLGGAIAGKPTVSVSPDGTRMDVFARVGNQIWHRGWAGFTNVWSAWENLNLSTDSDPVAVSWGRGHVDLFYRAADGQTRRYTWNGPNAWTPTLAGQGWITQPSLGGFAKGPPAVASQNANGLDVFVQGGDDGIYRNSLGPTGAFLGWMRVAGCTAGTPAVAKSDTLNLVVREKNTRRVLHDFESLFPSSQAGTSPMCCGLNAQAACHYDGCDSTLGVYPGGRCGACGAVNETACLKQSPVCQAGLGLDSDAFCRVCPAGSATFGGVSCRQPQVLSASKSIYGSVRLDVDVRAVQSGGFAMHPHVTNSNEVTGFNYQVVCHVGVYALAYAGHVGPQSPFDVDGPGRDDPGVQAVADPGLATDWPLVSADWQAGMGTSGLDCTLATHSTLQQNFDDLWDFIAGEYEKQFGVDDLDKGHFCMMMDCQSFDVCGDWACSTDQETVCDAPSDNTVCQGNYYAF